jgi:hypothetical protein
MLSRRDVVHLLSHDERIERQVDESAVFVPVPGARRRGGVS